MGCWNYRVIKKFIAGEPYYSVRECYYNNREDKIPHSWSAESSNVCCNSVEELKEDLNMMLLAFNKPVLVEEFNSEEGTEILIEDK